MKKLLFANPVFKTPGRNRFHVAVRLFSNKSQKTVQLAELGYYKQRRRTSTEFKIICDDRACGVAVYFLIIFAQKA